MKGIHGISTSPTKCIQSTGHTIITLPFTPPLFAGEATASMEDWMLSTWRQRKPILFLFARNGKILSDKMWRKMENVTHLLTAKHTRIHFGRCQLPGKANSIETLHLETKSRKQSEEIIIATGASDKLLCAGKCFTRLFNDTGRERTDARTHRQHPLKH